MVSWRQWYTVRTPCDSEGRDWSRVAVSQGSPKFGGKAPEARERQGRIP